MLVIGGMPGAGKSWLCSRLPDSVSVLDIDDFWTDEPGARRHMRNFDEDGFLSALESGLETSTPLALQLTALQPQVRLDLRRRAEKAGAQPHLLMLDVSKETAVAAQQERERQVPEETIGSYATMWERFKTTLKEHDGTLLRERYTSIVVCDREAAAAVTVTFGA